MSSNYDAYLQALHEENHMCDDHFGFESHRDYREENRRRVDRIIENFDGHVWENRERNRRNNG